MEKQPEAKGIGDLNLGKLQAITQGFVLTQRGSDSIERFVIPIEKVKGYDGHILRFEVTEDEALTKFHGIFESTPL